MLKCLKYSWKRNKLQKGLHTVTKSGCHGKLKETTGIHGQLIRSGIQNSIVQANNLIAMYGKCGCVDRARLVFDGMQQTNVFSWTALISAYAQCGHRTAAVALVWQMQDEGVEPDSVTFVVLLNVCSSSEALADGRMIHKCVAARGDWADKEEDLIVLGNALINMYSRCGDLPEAVKFFQQMPQKNVVSWTTIIGALARGGETGHALRLVHEMQLEGSKPDKITFVTILTACAESQALGKGRFIHGCIVDCGLESDEIVGTALVNMYGKCRSLRAASELLQKLPLKNIRMWTTLLEAYSQQGRSEEAVVIFKEMLLEGVQVDMVTLLAMANACAAGFLTEGKRIHDLISEYTGGFSYDVKAGNVLINMYAKCGALEQAREVFESMLRRDIVSWNTMVSAYVQHNRHSEGLDLFRRMDLVPNPVTLVAALEASAGAEALEAGRSIHERIAELGLEETDTGLGGALINIYGKCGRLQEALRVFNCMDQRGTLDVVSWTSIIAASTKGNHAREALKLFKKMQLEGQKPNRVTFITALEACAELAALTEGRKIHTSIAEQGLERDDLGLGNTLINMYSKCGNPEFALTAFETMQVRDVVSWTAIIGTLSEHGYGGFCVEIFHYMQLDGQIPNSVTFINMLCCCSHGGLVKEGCMYFSSMLQDYSIPPAVEHYGCLIDLLGRRGQLDDAEKLLDRMPFRNSVVVWTAFLAACKNHGDVKRAKQASQVVLKLDKPGYSSSALTILSNTYASGNCDHTRIAVGCVPRV